MRKKENLLFVVLVIALITIIYPLTSVDAKSEFSKHELTKFQTKLKELEYYKGKLDGEFGKKSKEALKQFQVDHKIDPSGELNKKTTHALMYTQISLNGFVKRFFEYLTGGNKYSEKIVELVLNNPSRAFEVQNSLERIKKEKADDALINKAAGFLESIVNNKDLQDLMTAFLSEGSDYIDKKNVDTEIDTLILSEIKKNSHQVSINDFQKKVFAIGTSPALPNIEEYVRLTAENPSTALDVVSFFDKAATKTNNPEMRRVLALLKFDLQTTIEGIHFCSNSKKGESESRKTPKSELEDKTEEQKTTDLQNRAQAFWDKFYECVQDNDSTKVIELIYNDTEMAQAFQDKFKNDRGRQNISAILGHAMRAIDYCEKN